MWLKNLARYRPRLGANPIIVKELRSRMRGARAFVILTGVLLLLGTVSYTLYRIVLASLRYTNVPLSPQIGQALFSALAFLELMMVCFIAPAVTAGALSSEQEKLTYEMLLATPLRPTSILWGKLVSALSYVFLLIFAAVPMASLVFIFGGVSLRDMIKALIILLAVAVTLGVVGIFTSAWLGRTARATVLSYLVVLALLFGPTFVYITLGVIQQREPPRWILVPNPVSALFSALTPASPGEGLSSIFWGLGMAFSGNVGMLSGSAPAPGIPRPLYHYTLPLYGLMALVLYLLASRLVQPTRRWRLGWKEVLAALGLFLLLGGAVALAFGATTDRYEGAGLGLAPTLVPVPVVVEEQVINAVTEAPIPMALPPTPVPTEPPAPALPPSAPATNPLATYTDPDIGFAFDYPVGWYLQDTPGWQIVLTSYDPATAPGAEGVPDSQARIDILREEPLGRKSRDELVADARAQAAEVLLEESWELGGVPAVRLQIVTPAGDEVAFLIADCNGHSLQIVGYGDLGVFDSIVRTLRPTF